MKPFREPAMPYELKLLTLFMIMGSIVIFIFWLYQIIDLVTRRDDEFPSPNDRIVWMLFLIFIPFIGAVVYSTMKPRTRTVHPRNHDAPPRNHDSGPANCLACFQPLPSGQSRCKKCGWSYREDTEPTTN